MANQVIPVAITVVIRATRQVDSIITLESGMATGRLKLFTCKEVRWYLSKLH